MKNHVDTQKQNLFQRQALAGRETDKLGDRQGRETDKAGRRQVAGSKANGILEATPKVTVKRAATQKCVGKVPHKDSAGTPQETG